MDAIKSDSKLSQQIINKRKTDIYLKVEPSSELLYKKLEEGLIFLDMYSGMV